MTNAAAPGFSRIALGLIAGGQGSRLGGIDKAGLRVGGQTQLRRLTDAFAPFAGELLLSRGPWPEPADLPDGLRCLPDRVAAGAGPIAALDALAQACNKPWLLTLPIDLYAWPESLAVALIGAVGQGSGAVLEDACGLQPLLACYLVDALRPKLRTALAAQRYAVRDLQQELGLARLVRRDWRLDNLNSPADLVRVGASLPPSSPDTR